MMKYCLFIVSFYCLPAYGQSYKEIINKHRQHYKQEFLTEERSPLTAADTGYLRFYAPDAKYRVKAKITLTPTFNINDTAVSLHVFQSLKLIEDPKYKDHLFVPFTDGTTYTETYGGGRYLDLSLQDIKDGMIELDFNKCYNPWCAFATGYSCPIPPNENRMSVYIKAGEMNFAKPTEH